MKKLLFTAFLFISSNVLFSQNFKLLGIQFNNNIVEKQGFVFVSDSLITITSFNKKENTIDTTKIESRVIEKTATQYKCKDTYFELYQSGVKKERKANIYYLKQYIGVNKFIFKIELLQI